MYTAKTDFCKIIGKNEASLAELISAKEGAEN